VLVFFVISGYLITMSHQRSPTVWIYIKNRCLRIFPGLAVLVLLTVFVMGPIVSTYPAAEYYAKIGTWNYLSNIALYFSAESLPGVFQFNPLPGVVNGSLWTLKYEFTCYIVVCLLGYFGKLGKKSTLAIFLICLAEVLLAKKTGHPLIYFLMFFASGMLLYLYRDSIVLRGRYAACASVLLLLAAVYGGTISQKAFVVAFALFGGYVILYLAFAPWLKLHAFSRYGDFSYGLYIYAFPIQQMLTYLLPDHQEWYWNFGLSLPLIFICAYFSWHFVERRALKMKGSYQKVSKPA